MIAGVLWIGLLYFFNWVNANVAAKLDADTKKKVVPELMPRALYWFRWGAAFTWITGIFLLLLVFYHSALVLDGSGRADSVSLPARCWCSCLVAPFIYDPLAKGPLKDPQTAFCAGIGLAAVLRSCFD